MIESVSLLRNWSRACGPTPPGGEQEVRADDKVSTSIGCKHIEGGTARDGRAILMEMYQERAL